MRKAAERTERDREHIGMLDGVDFDPIFIMGDHRTGTTVLYEVLGATQCFNVVTAHHIIDFGELLHQYVNKTTDDRKAQLSALFKDKGLRDRGLDGVQATPDTPEEYGFILRNERYRPKLKPGNLASLIELCKKVQLTSDPSRPVLLKNPWDFLNFKFVREAFPDSKFIFIHRNPINTINSQLRSTRSLMSTKNEYVAQVAGWYRELFRRPLRLRMARSLFSPHFNLGLRIVTRHVNLATKYFLDHVSSLPQSSYVSVRYEDLCEEPRQTINTILDGLGLKGEASVEYGAMINVRSGSLLDEVERSRESIFRKMRGYFEYFGYEA